MVQQLFNTIKDMQDEVRRLRGRLDRLSTGGVILPGVGGAGGTVPDPVDGAIIRGNATPGWERVAASIPAANVRNVLGLDNGDLRPSWKTALDATAPTALAFGDSGTPGTSLVFAHRDHRHQMDDVYITNMAAAL